MNRKNIKKNFFGMKDWDLWEAVTRSVRPLHPEVKRKDLTTPELPDSPSSDDQKKKKSLDNGIVIQKQTASCKPGNFGQSIYQKISKRKIYFDARVDLHGMTQERAYLHLLNFLQSAQHNDLRHVLIITGKGTLSGGNGILRRSVPLWLETSSFRLYIQAFETAARQHGGGGALYVRIRRL